MDVHETGTITSSNDRNTFSPTQATILAGHNLSVPSNQEKSLWPSLSLFLDWLYGMLKMCIEVVRPSITSSCSVQVIVVVGVVTIPVVVVVVMITRKWILQVVGGASSFPFAS